MTIFGRGNVAPTYRRDNNFLFRRFSVLYIRDRFFFFPLSSQPFFSLSPLGEDSRDAMRDTKTYRYVSRIRMRANLLYSPFTELNFRGD